MTDSPAQGPERAALDAAGDVAVEIMRVLSGAGFHETVDRVWHPPGIGFTVQHIVGRAIESAVARLQRERDEAVALLRECEWASFDCEANRQCCPFCDEKPRWTPGDDSDTIGHATDCRLAAFLAARPAPPQRATEGEG